MTHLINEIHHYWFGFLKTPLHFPREKITFWFLKNDEVDRYIREHYKTILEQAANDEFEEWKQVPRGYLCLLLVLDQFSRKIHRGSPKAYAYDDISLQQVLQGLEKKIDLHLYPVERCFFYMPLQHIENLKIQEKSVELYKKLLDDIHEAMKPPFLEFFKYAKIHHDRIAKFGRFPHRNAILHRPSTLEEEVFLKEKGSSF